ncbi:MAG: hypothetical protein V3S69_03960 [Dehalococcoidales bacterium]
MTKDAHFATLDGKTTGRSSHFYFDIEEAKAVSVNQNARATELGIKARYVVAHVPETDISLPDKVK